MVLSLPSKNNSELTWEWQTEKVPERDIFTRELMPKCKYTPTTGIAQIRDRQTLSQLAPYAKKEVGILPGFLIFIVSAAQERCIFLGCSG